MAAGLTLSHFYQDCTLHIFSSSVVTELVGWFESNLTTLKYIVPAKFLQGSQEQAAIGGFYKWGSDLQKLWILSAERKRKSDKSNEYKTWSQVSYRAMSLGWFNRPILRFSLPSPGSPVLFHLRTPLPNNVLAVKTFEGFIHISNLIQINKYVQKLRGNRATYTDRSLRCVSI